MHEIMRTRLFHLGYEAAICRSISLHTNASEHVCIDDGATTKNMALPDFLSVNISYWACNIAYLMKVYFIVLAFNINAPCLLFYSIMTVYSTSQFNFQYFLFERLRCPFVCPFVRNEIVCVIHCKNIHC